MWLTLAPNWPPVPSPKSHSYVIRSSGPSGSIPTASKSTVSGGFPEAGSAAASTVGSRLPCGLTVTSTVSVPFLPSGSVTVSVAV